METPPYSSKEARINRFKPIWRILLISNLGLGGIICEVKELSDLPYFGIVKAFDLMAFYFSVLLFDLHKPVNVLWVTTYMFAKARKKNQSIVDNKPTKTGMDDGKSETETETETKTEADNSSPAVTSTPSYEEPLILPLPVVAQPPKVLEPIPEDQQREIFQWILEEKRKVKPKDREERKRIDEEKALLKQFIRAESLPRI
ncbi:hypothetical protein CCACVL1_20624 [Corchorus capsularis]|uniref:Uncharacterized protein n=1 Tax=Corchorus capsularis TaxID=210143 RepID=A0A1R3HAC7_COCAP|nr:hypothetical protein CCACVL1_20624 [Corchorus capsularis]